MSVLLFMNEDGLPSCLNALKYSVVEDKSLILFKKDGYLQRILKFMFQRQQTLVCKKFTKYQENAEEGSPLIGKNLCVVRAGRITRKLSSQETEEVLRYMLNNRFDIVYLPGLTINKLWKWRQTS